MSQTKKPLYMWTGSEWILVGDGGGLSPQAASVIYATKEEPKECTIEDCVCKQ